MSNQPKNPKPRTLSLKQFEEITRKVKLPPRFADAGLSVVFVVTPTGQIMSGLKKGPVNGLLPMDDLNRLQQVRSIKRRFDSAVTKQNKSADMARIATAVILEDNLGPKETVSGPQVRDELGKFYAFQRRLVRHHELIKRRYLEEKSEDHAESAVAEFLLSQAEALQDARREYNVAVLLGNPQKLRLNDIIRRYGVSRYVANRLTGSMIQELPESLISVLWPRDRKKGFRLTYTEWNDKNILETHKEILRNCDFHKSLLRPESIRLLDPSVVDVNDQVDESKFAEIKIPVPCMISTDHYLRRPVQTRFSRSGAIQNTIHLLNSYTEVVNGCFNAPVRVDQYLELIADGFSYEKGDIALAKQLKHQEVTWKLPTIASTHLEAILDLAPLVREVRDIALKIASPNMQEAKLADDGSWLIDRMPVDDSQLRVVNYTAVGRPEVESQMSHRLISDLLSKRKRKKLVSGQAMSILGRESERLRRYLKVKKSPYKVIWPEIEDFLRSFIIDELQDAAARQLIVTLDKGVETSSLIQEESYFDRTIDARQIADEQEADDHSGLSGTESDSESIDWNALDMSLGE